MDPAEVVLIDDAEATGAAASTRASWEGSDIGQPEMDWLKQMRLIPHGVVCRAPGPEISPEPEEGERVVFLAHFERGFGLPISDFFVDFLSKYQLQPHHLAPNAITSLSAFVTLCEAYLGIWPTVEIWSRYFGLRQQSIPNPKQPKVPKKMTECGAALVVPTAGSEFPRILGLESCRKWLRTWFYVKNSDPEASGEDDHIRLPTFELPPPVAKFNWGTTAAETRELREIHAEILDLTQERKLTADDLLATFVGRRVYPLQDRAHKMCYMSGQFDPTRSSTWELSHEQIFYRVRSIARTNLTPDWAWNCEGYYRESPPPRVGSSLHALPR